jgi:DNA-directed RNA polymerase subunit RPC12/RpoP
MAIALALVFAGSAFAQVSGLQLSLGKISGIGLGGQIQGFFRLSASGPADIASVTFEMDGKEMGTVSQAPFALQFNTDSYAPGQHRFSATGRTQSGRVLMSNPVDAEIVSFSSGWQSMVRLLWPIFAVILLALAFAVVVPLLSTRGNRRYEPGAPRQYSIAGGTVCSRCARPYGLSLLSLHLLGSRLARCPYCGKWALARPASPEVLRAAAQSELQNQPSVQAESPAEMLRRQIEDSRMSR